ncbi:MAG: short-subunit dehydrogenase [Kiritimatiellia bacterium]|jgi:short-subunit dehydrogenase
MNVLITGASSGLGAALANELARRGHNVGLLARRADRLQDVALTCRTMGVCAAWRSADVTDQTAVVDALHALEHDLGPTDILVACAGGGYADSIQEFDVGSVALAFDLNVMGVVHAVSAVLPGMIDRRAGQIVAVSSLAGSRGLAPGSAYSAAKAGLSTLLEGWAVDLPGMGIQVTTIEPGFVATEGVSDDEHARPGELTETDAARRMADGILARRRYVVFPLWLVLLTRASRWLPWWVYEPLLAKIGGRRDTHR